MRKLITILLCIITSLTVKSQIVGISGTQTFVRKVSVNDGTKDSIFAMQSDRQFTTVHRYDEYGSNAKGIFLYGSLAGSSIDGTTEGLLALGHNAARINVQGYGVYLGYQSGYNATGFGNIFIGGYRPGFNQTSSSKGLIIGYNIDLANATDDGQVNIMSVLWMTGANDVTGTTVSATGAVGLFVKVPLAKFHTVGTVRHASLGSASADTTANKPLGIDSDGDIIPMTYWPGSGGTSNVDNLTTNFTDVGNVGTGLDDLMSYTIPAGQLATNGDYIQFTMTFIFAANANAKEVKAVYGATTFYASTSQVQNGGTLEITGTIVRTGAATQRITFSVSTDATLFVDIGSYVTAAETLSGTVVLKGQAECVSNDDVIQKLQIVRYWPN